MIGLQGIKVDSVSIDRREGEAQVTGRYSLVSTSDIVLAKQSFNTYGEVKVALSAGTQTALNRFMAELKTDIQNTLGLTEG